MTHAFLADRALISVRGADAESFLQNLITTDLATLEAGEAAPGALLTPQGKILFLFLIARSGDGFTLETDSASRDNLLKRLTMYKLRAAVELAAGDAPGVSVYWNEEVDGMRDRRFAKAGLDLIRKPGAAAMDGSDVAAYAALRTLHGIAETPEDTAEGDAFPHDILLDRSGGLSFRKGCYVGQEVVSRMQHRGTARRRLVSIEANADLSVSGTVVSAGGKPIGTLGTVTGKTALAVVRIDKAGEAIATGQPILAGDLPVTLTLPAWSDLAFPTTAGDEP